MEPDIDALYESHFERFWEQCLDDYELDWLVLEHFGDAQDQWLKKERGEAPEELYSSTFDTLYNWDADLLYYDPKTCVQCYAHRPIISSAAGVK